MEFLASAAFGLEGFVKRDLVRLGASNIRPQSTGGVLFDGDGAMGFLANLYLRTSDRVHLVLKRFEARSFEELFQGVRSVPFGDYLPEDAKITVLAQCARSQLMSPSDCQSIAKKAIIGSMQDTYRREYFSETGVAHEIHVIVRNDEVFLTLNTSGPALSKRGYRTYNGEAPLRETMAAALVFASAWRPMLPLFDPMCGTGTILIEAAFIALDRAPGLARSFDMEAFPMFGDVDFAALRSAAQARYEAGRERPLYISGSDSDPEALNLARRHIHQAGLDGRITIERAELKDAYPDAGAGVIVTNPPYGERMGDARSARLIARQLSDAMRARPKWSLTAITSDKAFEAAYGRRADARRRLYNGRIECNVLTFKKLGD
jgi:putative N6-adenine-specific DNA methylase